MPKVIKTESYLADCGHRSPREGTIHLWNARISFNEYSYPGQTRCPKCLLQRLEKSCIQCAQCGRVLIPTSMVHLSADRPIMDGLRVHQVGDAYVCCTCPECCPGHHGFDGYWMSRGFVPPEKIKRSPPLPRARAIRVGFLHIEQYVI